MRDVLADRRIRSSALLGLNLAVRAAIVYWLAEAWVLQDDPRFVGKAIPERNTIIVGSLSLLFPGIWYLRRLDWRDYPIGLDILYLSIYALDMAGNSFDLYESFRYFDLIPHLHSPGALAVVVGVYWVRRRSTEAPHLTTRGRLIETTAVAAGIATMVHVVLEAQEYYTDLLAGTVNVGGVADTVNDLVAGLVGALVYPPLMVPWFLGQPRVGWLRATVVLALILYAAAVMTTTLPRLADAVADRFATPPPVEALSAETRARLMEAALARASAPPALSGVEIRHAHDAVTVEDLMRALGGGYHSIEGDVGVHGATPVMRHDPRDTVELTFLDWLSVVAAADFAVVKIDIKRDRTEAIAADLRTAIEQYGLDECSLKLNADVLEGPGAYAGFTLTERLYTRIALKLEPDDLVRLSEVFPCAVVSIGAWTGPVEPATLYGSEDIRDTLAVAARLAAASAPRVLVAARWDLVTDEFVATMAAAGVQIDIWNSTTVASPGDPQQEVARLRGRYGAALTVIDLRSE
jgi:hypothetical protein